jgi:essential nuclear protein 1
MDAARPSAIDVAAMPLPRAKSPERSKSPARAKSPARSKAAARPANGRAAARAAAPLRKRRKGVRGEDTEEEDEEDEVLPAELTRKIIAQAREQQAEVDAEERASRVGRAAGLSVAAALSAQAGGGSSDEEDQEEEEEDELRGRSLGEDEYYEDVDELELDEQDERALSLFMGGGAPRARNLADIIMEKLAAAEERAGGAAGETGDAGAGEPYGAGAPMPALPPKVIEVYKGVGLLLKTYRSGKLPKAFKIVPRLANWEEVLYVTEPEAWSAVATREATKLFASNMNARMAQRFFNLVLLPAVQDDIREHGKLNFHLYLALKKALYKPAAFFKGVLLPLGDGGTTLREALIVSSVLAKVSVPMLHSAVAILKLAELDFCGANALFLRTLLLKRYALPYRVVDKLVDYFVGFRDDDAAPTLLWQQCLLAFAQHYKTEVTAEQKEALRDLLRVQGHPKLTPEIRRELFSGGRCRGDPYLPHAGGADVNMDLLG